MRLRGLQACQIGVGLQRVRDHLLLPPWAGLLRLGLGLGIPEPPQAKRALPNGLRWKKMPENLGTNQMEGRKVMAILWWMLETKMSHQDSPWPLMGTIVTAQEEMDPMAEIAGLRLTSRRLHGPHLRPNRRTAKAKEERANPERLRGAANPLLPMVTSSQMESLLLLECLATLQDFLCDPAVQELSYLLVTHTRMAFLRVCLVLFLLGPPCLELIRVCLESCHPMACQVESPLVVNQLTPFTLELTISFSRYRSLRML